MPIEANLIQVKTAILVKASLALYLYPSSQLGIRFVVYRNVCVAVLLLVRLEKVIHIIPSPK
jgi:hypothetical protein